MRSRRPQPATVVAIVALLVALSGTSLAAGGGSLSGDAPQLVKAPRRSPCPPQATRVGRLCFDSVPSGPVAGVKVAADRCAVAGGYLPTAAQLRSASGELRLGDGDAGNGQFTDSYFVGEHGRLAMTTVVYDTPVVAW